MPVDHLELAEPDRGGDVGHPVVEADDREPVAPLRDPAPGPRSCRTSAADLVGVAGDHPALARGDDLVPVEGERADVAERADAAAAVLGAVRLGGVLDERDPVRARHRQDRVHVGRVPVQVHDHDRLGPRRHRGRDGLRIEVPGARAPSRRTPASRRSRRIGLAEAT